MHDLKQNRSSMHPLKSLHSCTPISKLIKKLFYQLWNKLLIPKIWSKTKVESFKFWPHKNHFWKGYKIKVWNIKIIFIIILLLYFIILTFIFSIITESQINKILLGTNRNHSNCVKRDILCCIIQYKEFSHDKTTDTD